MLRLKLGASQRANYENILDSMRREEFFAIAFDNIKYDRHAYSNIFSNDQRTCFN
jgi:hypothetical protein